MGKKVLEKKAQNYKRLLPDVQDVYGFIEHEKCDALLFSCLIGCVSGVEVNVDAANGNPGQWFRRPIIDSWGRLDLSNECFSCGESKSTISRDMLLGLAWFAWVHKRLDISEAIIKQCWSNFGIMGEGVVSRTLMTPGLLSTFAWISYRLGGSSRYWLRWIPTFASQRVVGYQAHLAVLHGLLRDRLTQNNSHSGIYSTHYERSPGNPLFAYAAENEAVALKILNDTTLWPDNRLPTRSDRKTCWLPQRDPEDWLPAQDSSERIHSGGDFLFCWSLLKNEF